VRPPCGARGFAPRRIITDRVVDLFCCVDASALPVQWQRGWGDILCSIGRWAFRGRLELYILAV
jgi:hypothetical protein